LRRRSHQSATFLLSGYIQTNISRNVAASPICSTHSRNLSPCVLELTHLSPHPQWAIRRREANRAIGYYII
jgi:hypothetical protein